MLKTSLTWLLSTLIVFSLSTSGHAVVSSSNTISDIPLGTGTGVSIAPNIYFMFDNSGSMGWEYLPDHVNDNYCFNSSNLGDLSTNGSTPATITGNGITSCGFGNPPFNSSAFNYIAYDPKIQYVPAADYDNSATTYKSMTSANTSGWTDVIRDIYGVLFKSSGTTVHTNLLTDYPDEMWCTDNTGTDCRTNASGYQYPDTTTYKTKVATSGAPYYYTMSPAYYCTDYTGTSCQSTSDSTHAQAFNYLWCTNYTASSGTYSNCQALRDSTHVVPTYLGKTVTVAGAKAAGSITVNSASSYLGAQISGITVNGVQLISSAIVATVSDTANTLATKICTAIQAYSGTSKYSCPAAPSGATANLVATSNGAGFNGPIVTAGPTSAAHVITNAVGSFQIGSNPSASSTVTSITVGASGSVSPTELLTGTVAGSTSQNTTARAICNGINANTTASNYRARVVSSLGGNSPAWGSNNACTSSTSGTYVEIQSQILDSAENAKVITVTGPTLTSATATISIAGNVFSAGTRPGNLGSTVSSSRAITVTPIGGTRSTLFGTFTSSDTTTVPNSNNIASIDSGLRSKWSNASGFSLGGPQGSLIITAPPGSQYNSAPVTINAGTTLADTNATAALSLSVLNSTNSLSGLLCGSTNILSGGPYSGTGANSGQRASSLGNAINGNGLNGYTINCSGSSCTVTAPSRLAACTNVGMVGSQIAIGSAAFVNGSIGYDNLASALTVTNAGKFSNTGSDGPIPVTNVQPFAGYSDVTPNGVNVSTVAFAGGATAGSQRANVGTFTRRDILDNGVPFPKSPDRTDCVTTAGECSYSEEMTNFANWYAYYQTRCDAMKTGILRSFKDMTSDKRIGFNDIYDADHLDVKEFTLSAKQAWYARVAAKTCSVGGTPLQSGLAAAGRYYAGAIHTTNDPIQYSCQKNYTILSTDGYWNGSSVGKDSFGNNIGDTDSAAGINSVNTLPNSPAAPYRDGNARSGTLADVAKWFYDNDLRNGPDSINDAAHGNGIATTVAGAKAHYSNADVRSTPADPAAWQHMVTFTLGLGMDGLLHYDPDYLTGTSADYEALKSERKTWGIPGNDKQENVDDLWHAAVNGHGQYFSARNPTQLVSSLGTALSAIERQVGAASASATSNMEPVAGDNYLYAASYATDWTGDLESQTVSVSSSNAGTVSTTALWSAQAKLQARDFSASPRKILTYSSTLSASNGYAKDLTWGNLTATEAAYFSITGMSTYVAGGTLETNSGCSTTTAGSSPAKCSPLLDYLTGSSSGGAAAFRTRAKILGDIVDTKPVYVNGPGFKYTDAGYGAWQPSRSKAVYVSANDGMLHAFDADGLTGGTEKWAYVPSFVLNKLWKLADSNYASNHQFLVDGPISVGDVYINKGGTNQWRTVLVAGLGKGGNGYFAIDVTNPDVPEVLWEFTTTKMGYTYGNAEITKLPDGTWVAIFASGYDNVPAASGGNAPSGDGVGRIYVVKISDGSLLYTISTGAGSTSAPSNLGRISTWVADSSTDNTALFVYAGDMLGNLWRIALPTVTPAAGTTLSTYPAVLKLFTAPTGQMITVKPELGTTDGSTDHRLVFFGTGRYLSLDDKTDLTQQSIYGIYDDVLVTNATTMATQSSLVQQTLCGQGINPQPAACPATVPTTYRTTTTNAVPLGLGAGKVRGWYINLPDMGVGSERANVDPALQLGTLVVPSNVPTSSDCNSGGYSFMYYLDYKTGSFIQTSDTSTIGLAGFKQANALIAGQAIVRIGDKVISLVTTADKKYPSDEVRTGANGGAIKRVGWREIIGD